MPTERAQSFFLAVFSGALVLMSVGFARLAFQVQLDGPGMVKPVYQEVVKDCDCKDCKKDCCSCCKCQKGYQEGKVAR